MPAPRFDAYLDYSGLTAAVRALAEAHPDLARLDRLGASHEGRDIWLLTITNFKTGSDGDKPALWVDGNLHAVELVGSSACLHLAHALVGGYGRDADVTRCLDTRVFYICPRVNPDGAERALATPPTYLRSSTRPYPYSETPRGGLAVRDIDGDGRILSMRIEDPDGPWKVCEAEPRLLVRRTPTETGGRYFRLFPEGMIDDYDGVTLQLQRRPEGLDLNRNFPGKWRGEHEQRGAGPYPASEPEVRAVVDFIAAHRNICAGIAFHSYSGVLLRPFSYQDDTQMPAEDLWTFEKIGAAGKEMTGYPAVSAYHEFRYHPQEIITGALDDWLYEDLGLFAWTVEIWSPQRQAGIGEYKFIDWYREHPMDDDLKLLKWSDEALGGRGYVDWYPFEHPQLGRVELGGWDPLFSFWNPPPSQLAGEIARFPKWLVWHNLISPRLEIHEADTVALGTDHYRVRLVVRNSGWLPSYITKTAHKKGLVRGVVGEITLPAEAELVGGTARQELGQLEGRAYKAVSPTGWAGGTADVTDDRVKIEWTIRAPAGGTVELCARHERAGVVRATLTLGA